jgi:hypothetical protein
MIEMIKNRKLNPNKIKNMNRKVTEHFGERLTLRTGYDIETLTMDINNTEDVLMLRKDSEELSWFPQLQREFIKYPNSTIRVYESIGVCIVTIGKKLITMYNL